MVSRTHERIGDRTFRLLLMSAGILLLTLVIAIAFYLGTESLPALRHAGWGFFTSTDWNPAAGSFGALPFIIGTLCSSLLAIVIAGPLSLGVAVYLSELASDRTRIIVGFLIEMLAAVPSVVYGLWGIFVLAPLLRTTVQPALQSWLGWMPLFQGPPLGVGVLCAGLILAIMIIPTIASISREVLQTVPSLLREGALALGATRWEVIRTAVLKTSTPGIVAALILGLGRAFGETMAVTMVIGNRNAVPNSLFAPGQTMASLIANEYGEAMDGLHQSSLIAVGLTLLMVSLVINLLAKWFVRKNARSRS